jgi:hypothetical protein
MDPAWMERIKPTGHARLPRFSMSRLMSFVDTAAAEVAATCGGVNADGGLAVFGSEVSRHPRSMWLSIMPAAICVTGHELG